MTRVGWIANALTQIKDTGTSECFTQFHAGDGAAEPTPRQMDL